MKNNMSAMPLDATGIEILILDKKKVIGRSPVFGFVMVREEVTKTKAELVVRPITTTGVFYGDYAIRHPDGRVMPRGRPLALREGRESAGKTKKRGRRPAKRES